MRLLEKPVASRHSLFEDAGLLFLRSFNQGIALLFYPITKEFNEKMQAELSQRRPEAEKMQ